MSNQDYTKGIIGPENSLLEGLRAINEAVTGIALVVGDNELLHGILVDGDIRRALLNRGSINDPIREYMQRDFFAVGPQTSRAEVLELMQARSLDHIPVVNDKGRLVGLHTIHEVLGREERPNWAVIMAGGKGTRLMPITKNIPKPMVKVAGRPILERIVLHLVSAGIKKIFISVGYLKEVIEEHFGDGSKLGCMIQYLREDEPLGTGGALALLPERPEHSVLVLNGDLVVQADIGRLLRFHKEGKYHATIGVRPYAHAVAFGCVDIDGDKFVKLEEKPVLQKLINAGIYVLSPNAVASIPANTFYPITNLFEDAVGSNKICGAYLLEEDWMDVGNPAELIRANGIV